MKTNFEAMSIATYVQDLMNIHTNQNKTDSTWTIRVWDNCGWHAEVKNGFIKIHIHEDHRVDDPEQKFTYSCWIEIPVPDFVSTIGHIQIITECSGFPESPYEDAIEKLKKLKKLLDININEILEK